MKGLKIKNLVRISDLTMNEIEKIFSLASKLEGLSNPRKVLENKTFVLFFSSSSIRTRITFEKGIASLGGQAILFPSETLDKKEEIKDVVSYISNWSDGIIVRHSDINLIDKMCRYSKIPVINAMTKENHPCEILTDLYSISKLRKNYLDLNYTFVGAAENIGKAWVEAAGTFGFNLTRVCPKELEIDSEIKTFKTSNSFDGVIENTVIVLTDTISKNNKELMAPYQITADLMSKARPNALHCSAKNTTTQTAIQLKLQVNIQKIFKYNYIYKGGKIVLNKKKLRCPNCGGFENLDRLMYVKKHVFHCKHCGERINISE